ncbi:FG-GAP repeat domain-containing protein [Actinacidiphila glaucinigra]|uniref:FG-GAP repeat domain-containing protein n=1 Tax=Actinacidiphila glaucinigra TaxID=235986 RepID=UPI003716F970
MNGDGYADIVATDKDGKLRLYAGDGTGGHSAAQFIGTSGWGDALIAHRGDLTGFTNAGAAPDGYEDYVVRLADNKLYIYGGDGRGAPVYYTRHELVHPPSLDDAPDWRRIRQLTLPGDIDKNTTEGHAGATTSSPSSAWTMPAPTRLSGCTPETPSLAARTRASRSI